MADRMKDQDNKDAQESGRPVQLDREQQQGGKPGQQPGQHDKQHDKEQDKPGMGQKPGQPGHEHQNR
jgi:hypothetical protein